MPPSLARVVTHDPTTIAPMQQMGIARIPVCTQDYSSAATFNPASPWQNPYANFTNFSILSRGSSFQVSWSITTVRCWPSSSSELNGSFSPLASLSA